MKSFFKSFVPVIAGVILYIILFNIFHPFVVSGPSMEPTFHDGDVVICYHPLEKRTIGIGDVVVCQAGYKKIIKRVVACPGDSIYIQNGNLYVNDGLSPYQFEPIEDAGLIADKLILLDDEYFCLGDNRNNSNDSRKFGVFTPKTIKYIVKKRIWKG